MKGEGRGEENFRACTYDVHLFGSDLDIQNILTQEHKIFGRILETIYIGQFNSDQFQVAQHECLESGPIFREIFSEN